MTLQLHIIWDIHQQQIIHMQYLHHKLAFGQFLLLLDMLAQLHVHINYSRILLSLICLKYHMIYTHTAWISVRTWITFTWLQLMGCCRESNPMKLDTTVVALLSISVQCILDELKIQGLEFFISILDSTVSSMGCPKFRTTDTAWKSDYYNCCWPPGTIQYMIDLRTWWSSA